MTDDEHLREDQLFALMWAIKDQPPPAEGEGADPELARAMRALSDAYEAPLAVEHQLGPDTVARLLAHTAACKPCRMLLLEDGPGARAPRTQSDIVAEAQRKEDARRRLVVRFWLGASGGLVTFVAAQFVFQLWRDRQRVEAPEGSTLQRDPSEKTREIDPLIFGGMALVLVAAFLIADAYTIARELWIDFTRWKQAVPVIGKAWAARDKKRQQGDEG